MLRSPPTTKARMPPLSKGIEASQANRECVSSERMSRSPKGYPYPKDAPDRLLHGRMFIHRKGGGGSLGARTLWFGIGG